MKKHAYLFLAHNNFYTLEKALTLIDDERNDIYIHIDKKVSDFDFVKFRDICKKSNVKFTKKRYKCGWGSPNLVRAEMQLFKEAYDVGYDYYHLMSGADLPIKNQDYIHNFFANNRYEFVEVAPGAQERYEFRWGRFHILKHSGLLGKIVPYFEIVQDKLKINRIKNLNMKIYKGSEWTSLSHDGVGELIKNQKLIEKRIRFTLCSDEIYKQTIIFNSKLSDRVYPKKDIRLIDWERHENESPHTFTIDDFEMIKNSDCIFARKFVADRDREIIDKVCELVNS